MTCLQVPPPRPTPSPVVMPSQPCPQGQWRSRQDSHHTPACCAPDSLISQRQRVPGPASLARSPRPAYPHCLTPLMARSVPLTPSAAAWFTCRSEACRFPSCTSGLGIGAVKPDERVLDGQHPTIILVLHSFASRTARTPRSSSPGLWGRGTACPRPLPCSRTRHQQGGFCEPEVGR